MHGGIAEEACEESACKPAVAPSGSPPGCCFSGTINAMISRRRIIPSRNTRRVQVARPAAEIDVSSERNEPPVSQTVLAMVCLALLIAAVGIYSPTFGYGFVAYDDNKY